MHLRDIVLSDVIFCLITSFLTHMKNVSVGNDQCQAGQPAGQMDGWPAECLYVSKTFNIVIFFGTLNMINVRSCMMVVLIELCPFIPKWCF